MQKVRWGRSGLYDVLSFVTVPGPSHVDVLVANMWGYYNVDVPVANM